MMPGSVLNPGGRPGNAIEELRAKYLPRVDELMEELVKLRPRPLLRATPPEAHRQNIRRDDAIREILDRVLGNPPVAVDTTLAKVDIGAMFVAALKRANGSGQPANNDAEPLEPDDPRAPNLS